MYNNIPITDFKEIADNLGKENIYRFSDKTVCIFGGSGFIGTNLKLFFLYLNDKIFHPNHPVKIISVDNYIGRKRTSEVENENVTYIEHDITKPLTIKYKIDFTINASGHASPQGPNGYELWPLETIKTGSDGTFNVLDLTKEHGCSTVIFSSSEVLGTPDDKDIPSKEEVLTRVHTMNKRSCYDGVKVLLEIIGYCYRQRYNLDVKCIRLFNCVGYFNLNDKRVIPNYFSKALFNQPITVFAPGTQTRTLSFYTDVLTGILLILLNGKDYLWHCGKDTEEISMIELAYKVEQICGKEDLVALVPAPDVYKEEPKRRVPNIDKLRSLGFKPKVSLDEMLKRIYNYYYNYVSGGK